jgi:hypothetical protein
MSEDSDVYASAYFTAPAMAAIDQGYPSVKVLLTKSAGERTSMSPIDLDNIPDRIEMRKCKQLHQLFLVGIDDETPYFDLLSYMWTFIVLIDQFCEIAVGVRPILRCFTYYRKNITDLFNKYERTGFARQIVEQGEPSPDFVMNELAQFKGDMGRFEHHGTDLMVYAPNTSVGKRKFKGTVDGNLGLKSLRCEVSPRRELRIGGRSLSRKAQKFTSACSDEQ